MESKITEAQRLLVAPILRQEQERCDVRLIELSIEMKKATRKSTRIHMHKIQDHYIAKRAALSAVLELLIDVSS